MKISIAMATYNGEKYIERQLNSMLRQGRLADEVIICDDQSTDATADIVKEFIETHHLDNWFFEINETNKGFIGNFFGAIRKTTGDIIFLCDQDDEWEENRLQQMEKILVDNPNIMALNTAVKLIDGVGNPISMNNKKGYCNANILHAAVAEDALRPFSFDFLVKSNISPGCTMCVTKELKEKFLNYEEKCIEKKFPHDWFFNLLASLESGTYFKNTVYTKYRIHEHNTIGVDTETDEQVAEIKSTRQMREDIGKFHFDRAQFIKNELSLNKENQKYIEKYLVFAEKRYAFLQSLSIGKLCSLYKHIRMYYNTIGWKAMISDVLYCLRLERLFRR